MIFVYVDIGVAGTPVHLVFLLTPILRCWNISNVILSHAFTMSAFCNIHNVLDKSTAADIAATLFSSQLDYASFVF